MGGKEREKEKWGGGVEGGKKRERGRKGRKENGVLKCHTNTTPHNTWLEQVISSTMTISFPYMT